MDKFLRLAAPAAVFEERAEGPEQKKLRTTSSEHVKRDHRGTDAENWFTRVHDAEISKDLAAICCLKNCTHNLTIAGVKILRIANSRRTPEERRVHLAIRLGAMKSSSTGKACAFITAFSLLSLIIKY
jgi:hypothetical protein